MHDYFLHGCADEPGALVEHRCTAGGIAGPRLGRNLAAYRRTLHRHQRKTAPSLRFPAEYPGGRLWKPLRLTWQYGDTGLTTFLPGKRVHRVPVSASPPSPAGEVDQNLDAHLMDGFMLRHAGERACSCRCTRPGKPGN